MSQIKKFFKSRFIDGYIVEFDFSQLEVIALAQLSQDPQLIADILAGTDMHCVRAAELFGRDVSSFITDYHSGDLKTIEQRRIAKAFSFQLQYGSGPKNMAKTNDVPVAVARKFIADYYNRYPVVKQWQDEVITEVKQSRFWDGSSRTESGKPAGVGTWTSPTGRIYTFTEYDNEYRPGETCFSPTQIKNYPVQGYAADLVFVALGKIYRRLQNTAYLKDHFLMVNTVHDSIVFDVYDKETLDVGVSLIKPIMENIPTYMKEIYGIEPVIPQLKVDVEYGKNWMVIKKYEK